MDVLEFALGRREHLSGLPQISVVPVNNAQRI
jgi:hypothetical protein